VPDVKKITREEAEDLLKKHPARVKGQWAELIEEIKKDGIPRYVKGVTRGQAWGLARAAKAAGMSYRVLEKGETILVIPPKPKGK